MFKYWLQMIVGVAIFIISTFCAWYEGSEIVENSFEWNYSTPFTNVFIQVITNGRDISQLDYFVYAVKFHPLFPTMMMISLLYILAVAGIYLIKVKSKWVISFWGIVGLICVLSSAFISISYTIGSSIFFWITSISGLLFIVIAGLMSFTKYKNQQNGITNEV
ncbi:MULTISPECIES: YjdJ family protein [Ureibacillus]|jgi:hypothetical protein|uniref:DUF4306 domain-containing protein n=1 Tax=Ureibacillus thermosphaericus TaxID=51173 RepID=A0A840Q096_URETH|nr:YjdJ family protein [Ureibacillus thermosphaericus]MBB5150341.1 hypothetical protein [Ureibacillus thermosphaericus]NKZ32930.1 YjdJ family protein [Ureibacillus thermosphaericus]